MHLFTPLTGSVIFHPGSCLEIPRDHRNLTIAKIRVKQNRTVLYQASMLHMNVMT